MLILSLPWMLILLILVAVVCLIKKHYKTSLIILAAIFITNRWCECIPLRLWPVNEKDNGQSIKVMTFNIDGSMERINLKSVELSKLIKQNNPDIIFISEFSELNPDALDTLLKSSYPYTTFKYHVYFSHYFYSKYPILNYKSLPSQGVRNNSVFYEGKFDINGNTIVIYGCHLPSNNYTEERKYLTPDSIKTGNDVIAYIKNVNSAYMQRADETSSIIKEIAQQQHPIIVMGDFNDIGGSAAVRNIESAGIRDAWWEGGVGYGATIHRPLPYRIDHIMHNKDLKLKDIKVVKSQGLSDHDALYAEFFVE